MQRLQVEQNIARFSPVNSAHTELRHAAVAIVILENCQGPGKHAILLTLRTSKLKQHAGQYALPGGKLDEGETTIAAAIREVEEELGFSLSLADCLGVLDDYITRSGFCITPVMFWAPADTLIKPCADEVQEVYQIPFCELDSDAIPVFEPGVDEERPVPLSQFPTLGHSMYSPTASIIYQFREVAIRGLQTRVGHFDQPAFAWK